MTLDTANLGTLMDTELERLTTDLKRRRLHEHVPVVTAAMQAMRRRLADRVFRDYGELVTELAETDDMPEFRAIQEESVWRLLRTRRMFIAATVAQREHAGSALDIETIDHGGDLRWRDGEGSTRAEPRSDEELRELLGDHLKIGAYLGPSQLMDYLVSTGQIEPHERLHVLRYISRYLGECVPPPGGGGGILVAGPEILQHQSVYPVARRLLRREIYQRLIDRGGDDPRTHDQSLSNAGTSAQQILEDIARAVGVEKERHASLFGDLKTYFEQAAALQMPAHMTSSIALPDGSTQILDSWRNRIAVMETMRQRHLYVGSAPGSIKTIIPFWFHERMKAQRMAQGERSGRVLYLGPLEAINELPNRIQPGSAPGKQGQSYYLQDAPGVGVIRGGICNAELEERLKKEVVFFSTSMLHRARGGSRLYERLLECEEDPFTLLVVDEAHFFQGDEIWTRIARELIHGISGLFERGNILFLSGTPATSSLLGLRVQLELLEPIPEGFAEGGSRSRVRNGGGLSPHVLRNQAERLLVIDQPDGWLDQVTPAPYELSREEHAILRMIVQDNTLTHQEKLHRCLLTIRDPALVSGNPDMSSSFQTWHRLQLEEYLSQHDSIIIAEHMQSDRVLRAGKNDSDDAAAALFHHKVQEYCEAWAQSPGGRPVRFHCIHGKDKGTTDRHRAFRDLTAAKQTHEFRTVIVGQSGCFSHGIDLQHTDVMISNQYPWTLAHLEQGFGRIRRGANRESARMVAFYAAGTVEEGIFLHARDVHGELQQCVYGMLPLSERKQHALMQEHEDVDTECPEVASFLDSSDQHLARIQRDLHNIGAHGCWEYWERNRQDLVPLLDREATTAAGDKYRFLASLIADLEHDGLLMPGRYLHTNSLGLSVDRMLRESSPHSERQITSMDPRRFMLDAGMNRLPLGTPMPSTIEGAPADLIGLLRAGTIEPGSLHVVILDGLEQMHMHVPEDGSVDFTERVDSLIGAVRALEPGGTMIIPLPREACTKVEFDAFVEQLQYFGLTVLHQRTGLAQSSDNAGDAPYQSFVVVAMKGEADPDREIIRTFVDPAGLKFTHIMHWAHGDRAERSHRENGRRNRQLPYAILHAQFRIGRHHCGTSLGAQDRAEQLAHLEALRTAVKRVRNLAPTSTEFLSRVSEFRATLVTEGIEYWQYLSGSGGRLAFRLAAYPGYLFFPYDTQWNKIAPL